MWNLGINQSHGAEGRLLQERRTKEERAKGLWWRIKKGRVIGNEYDQSTLYACMEML
jgi:hypothetical protein